MTHITPCTGRDLDACETCRRLLPAGSAAPHVRLHPMVRGDDCADHIPGAAAPPPPLSPPA